MLTNRILIVEDNLPDFVLLTEHLSQFGFTDMHYHHCRCVADLDDESVAGFSPTFVFADLHLHDGQSPYETFLQVQRAFPSVPVIIISGLRDEHIALKCIQAGALNFIEKGGYEPEQLRKIISFATEQNRLRQENERLKADYQRIFDENPLAMLLVDKKSNLFIRVNTAAAQTYGYSIGEFLKLQPEDLSKPTNKGAVLCPTSPAHTIHYKKNGDAMYIAITSSSTYYQNADCLLLTVKDLSVRLLAAEEERNAKQRLEAIFQGANDAIMLTDDRANYVQVNVAAAHMLGYTVEELLQLSVPDIVVQEISVDNDGLWNEFKRDGEQKGVIELRRKDGRIIICHYNAAANILPGLHLSILTDITEREHTRREVTKQKNKVQAILENISDCFYTVDHNWIIQYWNRAAEELIGISKAEVTGKSQWEVFGDLYNTLVFHQYHKAVNEQVPVHFEYFYEPKEMWVDISAYPTSEGLTIVFRDVTYKKNESLALEQERKNHLALINSTDDLIWSLDADFKLISCNNAFAERIKNISGRIPHKGMQMPLNIYSKERYESWVTNYSRAMRGEAFKLEESIVVTGTEHTKLAELTFTPLYDINSGEVKGIACYSHDITERMRNQMLIEEQNAKLKESEEHLKKLSTDLSKIMNSSLDVICSFDSDGRFLQVSNGAFKMWGYKPQELIGKSSLEFVHADDHEKQRKMRPLIQSGLPVTNLENRFIHKNGSIVPLTWSARWDEQEKTMFCIARDASAIKEAEKTKAETEQKFTTLVEKGADMIAIIDEQTNYLFASPNVKAILGFERDQLIGKNGLTLIHPDDREEVLVQLSKVIEQQEVKLAAFRLMNGKGEWRWIETIATNQINNPAIKGIVLNSRDITARKQIETERELMIKELTKSNDDLKQFSFITSHNLRSPLSNITGILNIINYDALDSFNKELIGMMQASTNHLTQTINDLTKILIIKNNINVDTTLINLKQAFTEVNGIFSNALNDVCGKIVTDFNAPQALFNKTYLESIFVNLMSNAIRYRSADRLLQISVSTYYDDAGNVVFKFSDNGIGIDMQRHKDKVFGLYQRFHTNPEGQGMGLFMIKSQIVALGGSIEIQSEIDKGTTFNITFWNKDDLQPEDNRAAAQRVSTNELA